MRTRTSPRLQESLWRQLGGISETPIKADKVEIAKHALAQPFLSSRMRKMFERDLPAPPVACPLCERLSSSPGGLLEHLETIHEDDWNQRKDNLNDEVVLFVKKLFTNTKPRRR